MKHLPILILVMLLPSRAAGQLVDLVINEVTYEEPSLVDENSDTGFGWIELKNLGAADVNIAGISLVLNDTLSWSLPDTILKSQQYFFIWLSGKDRGSRPPYHASFEVQNLSGNHFLLRHEKSDKILDSITIFSKLQWRESFARIPDGGTEWLHVTTRTAGHQNVSFGMWQKFSSTAPFMPRDAALNACLYFREKFWILSGWTGDSSNPSREVWSSDDLREWKNVNPEGPYTGGANFIVFKDKMWAFDSTAYSTEDGVTWEEEARNLPFGQNNRITIFRDRLWVVSGRSLFSSEDGLHWSLITDEAPWDDRTLPGFLEFRDQLWFFGGAKDHPSDGSPFKDIWSSSDGYNWKLETDNAQWPGRAWFGYTVFDDKMWLFGGWDAHAQDDINDVWFTHDGLTWSELKSSVMWGNRHAPYHWVAKDALWISSGFNTRWYGLYNDTWKLDRHSLHRKDTFYLKQHFTPTMLEAWSSTADGNGFPPEQFSFDNQNFVLVNNRHASVERDWHVSGRNSVVVVGNGSDSSSLTIPEGVIMTAEVHQNSLSTLVIKNETSPYIKWANKSSITEIDASGDVELLGNGVSNLRIARGNLWSEGAIKVLNELALVDGTVKDFGSIEFQPGSTLAFLSRQKRLHRLSLPSSSPSTMTINCDCSVLLNSDINVDTLNLYSGRVRMNERTVTVSRIRQRERASFLITDSKSLLSIQNSEDSVSFPIGVDGSYSPLHLSHVAPGPIMARVYPKQRMPGDSCKDFSVRLIWDVFSPSPIAHIGLTVQWDSSMQGASFKNENAMIFSLADGKPLATSWVRQEKATGYLNLFAEAQLGADAQLYVADSASCAARFSSSDPDIMLGTEGYGGSGMRLYPNPSKGGKFTIEGSQVSHAVVYELTGRVASELKRQDDGTFAVNNELPAGIYVVKVVSASGTLNKRVWIY